MINFEKVYLFKDNVLEINELIKKLDNYTYAYGIPGGFNIFNPINLFKILNKLLITDEDTAAECINSIIPYISDQKLNKLVGNSQLLLRIDSYGIKQVETILINEINKRNQLRKLKQLFINNKLNECANDILINDYIDIFFDKTNNVRDIISLFNILVNKTQSYKDEHFNKFYKIMVMKENNIIYDKNNKFFLLLNNIEKFIKEEHKDKFNSIFVFYKIK